MFKANGKDKGFTLIELLIALSIFAVLGVGAYQLINSMVRSQSAIEQHSQTLNQQQKALHILHRDLLQITQRSIRLEYQDIEPALIGDSVSLSFTRTGWQNPLQQSRSNLQRVNYSLDTKAEIEGTHLIRRYWPVLDRAPDSSHNTQLLLREVNELSFSYLDDQGNWQEQWPANKSGTATEQDLPNAIQILIESPTLGEYRKLIQLRKSTTSSKAKGSS